MIPGGHQMLDANPDTGSVIYQRMEVFLGYEPYNYTFVNETGYNIIMSEICQTHATPAIWFYGAAVSLRFLVMSAEWLWAYAN